LKIVQDSIHPSLELWSLILTKKRKGQASPS